MLYVDLLQTVALFSLWFLVAFVCAFRACGWVLRSMQQSLLVGPAQTLLVKGSLPAMDVQSICYGCAVNLLQCLVQCVTDAAVHLGTCHNH
jgi:hypothetical protein